LNKKRAPIRKYQTIKSGKRHFGKTHVSREEQVFMNHCSAVTPLVLDAIYSMLIAAAGLAKDLQ